MLFVQRADKSSVKRVIHLLASGSDAGKTGITASQCLQRSLCFQHRCLFCEFT